MGHQFRSLSPVRVAFENCKRVAPGDVPATSAVTEVHLEVTH
jgi:hypothetical protein